MHRLFLMFIFGCDHKCGGFPTISSQNFAMGCLKQVLHENVQPQKILTTIFLATDNTSVVMAMEDLFETVFSKSTLQILSEPKKPLRNLEGLGNYKSENVVIVVDSYQKLSQVLGDYSKMTTFNNKAHFFVYFTNSVDQKGDQTAPLLWRYQIHKSLVAIPKNDTSLQIFILDVYTKSKECGEKPRLKPFEVCTERKTPKLRVPFFGTLPKKLECSLDVYASKVYPYVLDEHRGFEIKILTEIGMKFAINFRVKLIEPNSSHWDNRRKDKTYPGILGYIYNHSKLAIGHLPGRITYREDFDLSLEYFHDSLTWVVPKAGLVPKWKHIFIVLSPEIWLATLFIVFATAGGLYFSTKISNDTPLFNSFNMDVINTIRILIGGAVNKTPKYLPGRLIFVSIVSYSFLVSSTYQSFLIDFLMNPISEYQISSEEDILRGGLKIGVMNGRVIKTLLKASRPEFQKLTDTNPENDTVEFWLLKIKEDSNVCTIGSRFSITAMVLTQDQLVCDENGFAKVHLFKNDLLFLTIHLLMPKGFPLKDSIDDFIAQLKEFGFVSKWWANSNNIYLIKMHDKDRKRAKSAEFLTIDHLKGAFLVLFCGCAFAFSVFVVEIYVGK